MKNSGVAAIMRREIPRLRGQHCVAYREDLAVEDAWKELSLVLDIEILEQFMQCSAGHQLRMRSFWNWSMCKKVMLWHCNLCTVQGGCLGIWQARLLCKTTFLLNIAPNK